jgi:hypothetical protein
MTKEVLKLALEALEDHGHAWPQIHHESRYAQAMISVREALAQPEQEPVAKVKRNSSGQIYIEWRDGEGAIAHLIGSELYTTPPHRLPLTDEQIEDLYFDKFSMGELKAFARAIEAAHGIKE